MRLLWRAQIFLIKSRELSPPLNIVKPAAVASSAYARIWEGNGKVITEHC